MEILSLVCALGEWCSIEIRIPIPIQQTAYSYGSRLRVSVLDRIQGSSKEHVLG